MVRRGLVASLDDARAAIETARVTVAGAPADKAERLVAVGDPIIVHDPAPRFVSRGGVKLDAALGQFAIDVDGARALDAGASTGGFTDCLLQHGAGEVVAVDVGYGQLHERLTNDRRVRNVERTNIRDLDPAVVGAPFDIVVADLSFISLARVLDGLLGLCRPQGVMVMLVKPQFEANRAEAAKGQGVVTDPVVWRRVLHDVITALQARGAVIMGVMVSPITGAEGNVEFLLAALVRDRDDAGAPSGGAIDLDVVLAEAIERRRR